MGNCSFCSGEDNQRKIVFLVIGLDNSGKTTLTRSLSGERWSCAEPTMGFSKVNLDSYKGYEVSLYDFGGSQNIRDKWKKYFRFIHGTIFVVDASDRTRLNESKIALESVLLNDKIAGKPLLVLGNKQDAADALKSQDIIESLDIGRLVNRAQCHTVVQTCTACPKRLSTPLIPNLDNNLLSGFRWLLRQVIKDYDLINERVMNDVEDKKIKKARKKEKLVQKIVKEKIVNDLLNEIFERTMRISDKKMSTKIIQKGLMKKTITTKNSLNSTFRRSTVKLIWRSEIMTLRRTKDERIIYRTFVKRMSYARY